MFVYNYRSIKSYGILTREVYNMEVDNRYKLVDINRFEDNRDEIIEKCIRNIIVCLGDDPDRTGLQETPKRVRKMYDEIFEGMKYTNKQVADMFNKCFEDIQSDDLVTICNIPVFSTCEHHLATMYNMQVHVGYIPNGKVIGLSKVARIADMVSKRFQLQERIGTDIADILEMILDTKDIAVVIEGEHSCMTMRGIKKIGTKTRTATLRGQFDSNYNLRQEFYSLIKS